MVIKRQKIINGRRRVIRRVHVYVYVFRLMGNCEGREKKIIITLARHPPTLVPENYRKTYYRLADLYKNKGGGGGGSYGSRAFRAVRPWPMPSQRCAPCPPSHWSAACTPPTTTTTPTTPPPPLPRPGRRREGSPFSSQPITSAA